MQQDVHLMNCLVDERAAAFGLPTAFDGAGIVFVATEPLNVSVGLEQFA